MISRLSKFIARERILYAQRLEIERLRTEVEGLRRQNEKIHRAMRRCLTCEHRIEAIAAD